MKTVEKVFEALKNEGLVPVMENFGISFKFQMTNYVYMEDENDESFFNLLIPNIYDVSEENELEVSVEEGMEVFADADLVSQVLVNLLQNANTHTQGGRIEVRAFLKDGKYQVEITDNGSGIAPELLPHVFERGVSDGGTGFGLFLSKSVVESHHGKIWIESRQGEGTKVSFVLPVYEGQRG